jgi:hypothetical protein
MISQNSDELSHWSQAHSVIISYSIRGSVTGGTAAGSSESQSQSDCIMVTSMCPGRRGRTMIWCTDAGSDGVPVIVTVTVTDRGLTVTVTNPMLNDPMIRGMMPW